MVGWGHASFDRVKNESEFASYRDIPDINGRANPSHNISSPSQSSWAFFGLLLFGAPWAIIGWRA